MSILVCKPGDEGYLEPGTKEWNESLSASRVADVIGRGYGTPLKVWKQIKGMSLNEHKRIYDRGHAMEPFMTARVQEMGRKVVAEQVQYRDPARPWLVFHADGMFPEWSPLEPGDKPQKGPGIAEWKAPGSNMAQQMAREGLANTYIVQMQIGMHIANVALASPIRWGSAGFWDYDNWDLVVFDISRNQRFIGEVLEQVDYFWDEYVMKDIPPPEGLPSERPTPPEIRGSVVEIDDSEIVDLAAQLMDLKPKIDELKQEDKIVRDALKRKLVAYEAGAIPGIMSFSYREGKDRVSYDAEALFAFLTTAAANYRFTFNPDHFRTVKPGGRTFRPTAWRD